jgi:acyl-CoA-binding protein
MSTIERLLSENMTTQNISIPNNNDDDGLESVLGDGDDEFQEAALFVQNNLTLFSRDDLLYLYARFKQVSSILDDEFYSFTCCPCVKVTVGDINIARPGYFSFEAKTKWYRYVSNMYDYDSDHIA